MNSANAQSTTFFNFHKESNKEDPIFKNKSHIRISNYKNIFVKSYILNRFEEAFLIKKVKTTAPWIYAISDLNGKEIAGKFEEKELQTTYQTEFRVEKVTKENIDELYVKWKDCDDLFFPDSWIDKKDIVI